MVRPVVLRPEGICPGEEIEMSDALKRRQRCAVYTRKSSEEGLEQEYNSIDAQRDAGHPQPGRLLENG